MYGNQNGTKVFSIPVEWVVTETIDIKANSLREVIEFINKNVDEILETLDSYGYTERNASEYDEVEEL